MKELNIGVPVSHYVLATEESIVKVGYKQFLKKPEEFGKVVIVIRDLHDVMASMVFWIEQLCIKAIQSDSLGEKGLKERYQFLEADYDEQLLDVIESRGLCQNSLYMTKLSCELILELLKRPQETYLLIRFEDFIGIQSGGNLSDPERFKLLSDMCAFLGYERSPQQVEAAVNKIFGNSNTYNPIKKKVGRGKESFNQIHQEAFEKHWKDLNDALGYE